MTFTSVVRCICMYIDGAHIGWSMTSVSSLAELNNEIQWRTKEKHKLAFCEAISEIHAVLAVLCEIDKVIALHACMQRRRGMRDSWYHPISTICSMQNWCSYRPKYLGINKLIHICININITNIDNDIINITSKSITLINIPYMILFNIICYCFKNVAK